MYTTTMWAIMLGYLVVATGAMHLVNKPGSKVSSPSNPFVNLATQGSSNTCAAGCQPCGVTNAVTYSSGCQVATCIAGLEPSADSATCEACNVANAASYSSGCQVATCVPGMGPSADSATCEDLWELVWFTGQRTGSGDCFDYDHLLQNFQQSVSRCQALGESCRYIYDWGCGALETAGVDGQPMSVLQSMTVVDDYYRVCGSEANSAVTRQKVATSTPGTYHCALTPVVWDFKWLVLTKRTIDSNCYGYDTLYSFQDALTACMADSNCKYVYDWGCTELENSGAGDGRTVSVLQSMTMTENTYRLCGSDFEVTESPFDTKVGASDSLVNAWGAGEVARYHCGLVKPGS